MTGLLLASCFATGIALLLCRHHQPARLVRTRRIVRTLFAGERPPLPAPLLIAAAFAAAVSIGVVVFAVTQLALLAALAGCALFWAPFARLHRRAQRARSQREQAWPDAINQLADALEAGIALPAALALLGTHGPTPLRSHLASLHLKQHTSGLPEALDQLRRTRDQGTTPLAILLGGAHDVGGAGIAPLLRQLAQSLARQAHSRAKAESRAANLRLEARLLALSPLGFLGLIGAVSPGYLNAYRTSGGTLIAAIATVAISGCYQAMRRLGRLPTSNR